MSRDVLRQIAVALAVVVTIAINGLANALPLNGQQTGAISDRFPILFVPAGYVFSIWGVIYLGMLAYAAYQALPGERQNPRLRAIAYPFLLSCLANIVWLFLWHYNVFTLTLVAMLTLLLALIAIYLRLDVNRRAVTAGERWFVHVPFSIYLGWITVATIANTSQLLYFVGWDAWGLSGETWTVLVLAVAVAIAFVAAWTRRDVAYLLVLVWAFAGIAVKHSANPVVMPAAAVAAVLVAVFAAWSLFGPSRRTARITAG